jgi:hypothetical protein
MLPVSKALLLAVTVCVALSWFVTVTSGGVGSTQNPAVVEGAL